MRSPIMVKIADLVHDPENANVHDDRNLSDIAESLRHYGQTKSILIDENNHVIAGNGTLMAAKMLHWEEVRCIVTQLKGEQLRGYAIADNQTARYSDWVETDLIEGLLSSGGSFTAYTPDEVDALINRKAPEPKQSKMRKVKIECVGSMRDDLIQWLEGEMIRRDVGSFEEVILEMARGN